MIDSLTEKMRDFADPNTAMMYACVQVFRDWQAETDRRGFWLPDCR